jgi:twinkle protein
MGTFIGGNLPCTDCGSSDALQFYKDDKGRYSTYCYSCQTDTQEKHLEGKGYLKSYQRRFHQSLPTNFNNQTGQEEMTEAPTKKYQRDLIEQKFLKDITRNLRHIPKEVFHKYQVQKYTAKNSKDYFVFPGHRVKDTGSSLVAHKVRNFEEKHDMFWLGDNKDLMLFGQFLFLGAKKSKVTITEGEFDAMAAYALMGGFPAVSVNNGSSGALKDCKKQFQWLNSFDEIRIAFDSDENGQKAAEQVARLFGSKALIIDLDKEFNDPNGYLQAFPESASGRKAAGDLFMKAFWGAKRFSPATIVCPADFKDAIKNRTTGYGVPYPYEGLNKLTYGMRPGELTTFMARTGVGKSTIFREIAYHTLINTKENIGMIFLEEPKERTAEGLISIHLQKPLHLPDVRSKVTDAEWDSAMATLFDDRRIYMFDHFGSADIDKIIETVEWLVKGCGCSIIMLDHISMVTSDQRNNDERVALNRISNKLNNMTQDANHPFHLLQVVHVNRQGEIHGTSEIEKISHVIFNIDRDINAETEEQRNLTKISCKKNRPFGFTGPAAQLRFDAFTNRMIDVTDWEEEKTTQTPEEDKPLMDNSKTGQRVSIEKKDKNGDWEEVF